MADDLEIVIRVIDSASGELDKIRGSAQSAGDGIAQAAKVGFGALGVAADVAVVASVKAAESFQTMVANIRGNTTMTAADAQAMGDAIKRMSVESGASLDQLGQGWMHITNFGFQAADAQKILTAAMESGVAAGADVGATANVLAGAMKEFGISADDAGKAMDVLHVAAASGNMTLEDIVDTAGKALSTAANLGVSLTDTAAALSTLTQHGFDASQAATQLTGILTHIVTPSKEAQTELKKLSDTTGIDLVTDFSAAGLKAKGLSGVLDDVHQATAGNTDEILKLIPALRGGQGAMVLAGNGAADMAAHVQTLNAAYDSGQITTDAYKEKQKTLGNELDRLGATVHVAAIDIGTALIPAISDAAQAITPLIEAITTWIGEHPQLTAVILGTVGVVGTLVGGLALLQFAFGPLTAGFGALSTLISTTAAMMTGSAGASEAAAGAMTAQAGAAGVDAEALNALVAALLAQAEAEGLAAEGAMNAAASDAALAAAGGEAAAAEGELAAAGEAAGAGLAASLGPLGLVAAASVGLGVAIKEVIVHLQDGITQNKAWVDAQNAAIDSVKQQIQALASQGASLEQVGQIAKQNASTAETSYQQAQIAVENYANAHRNLSEKQLNEDATFQQLSKSAAVARATYMAWVNASEQATQQAGLQSQAQKELGQTTETAAQKAADEASQASYDADAQTRLSEAIDKAAKGGASAIPFFDQLAEAHKFAGMSADDQNAALADLQTTIDTGKGKAQSAAQSQMDLDLAIRTMGGSALDASIQYEQLLIRLGLQNQAETGKQQLRDIDNLLNNINTDATTAGNAITGMFSKPSQEMLNTKADLADLKAQQAGYQVGLAQLPPVLQHVAAAQQTVDDAWYKGTLTAQQLADRQTAVSAATQIVGSAATQAALGLQNQNDTAGHLITTTQTHITAMQADTDAKVADTQAAVNNAASIGQQTDEYNKALPKINGLTTAQQNAATTTQQASDTVNAAYAQTRDAHTDMATTIQTNTSQIQTNTSNTAADVQGASADMQFANAAAGKSFDAMNQGAQTAMQAMLQTVANGIFAVQLTGVPAARSAGTQIGAALDAGIEAGVQASAGAVAAAAANTVTSAINAAKAAAAISSPSQRAWNEIGVPLGQGVSGGFAQWMNGDGNAEIGRAIDTAISAASGFGNDANYGGEAGANGGIASLLSPFAASASATNKTLLDRVSPTLEQTKRSAEQTATATQQTAAALQRLSSYAPSGGGSGGGSYSGAGGGLQVEGIGAIFGGPIVTLPGGEQYIGTPAGMNQLAIMQGYANQSALDAQIAAQNAQSTGPIQAGPVSITVSVAGADPRSSMNVALV